jgi:chorismate mutase
VKELAGELNEHRAAIDEYDAQILTLLAMRLQRAKQMGQIKTAMGKPLRDPLREKQIFSRLAELNNQLQSDVPPECIEEVFAGIIGWSLKVQQKKGS